MSEIPKLTDEQKISIMKLHGCGWNGPKLRKMLEKLPLGSPDPFWDLLEKSSQLSPEELRTGKHDPFHGWAKEFVAKKLKEMD
jgi:hypothetical protein